MVEPFRGRGIHEYLSTVIFIESPADDVYQGLLIALADPYDAIACPKSTFNLGWTAGHDPLDDGVFVLGLQHRSNTF